jgi:hypothetical protein
VNSWRKRYPTDNRLLFLDLIPFRETREYVATILRNYFWYTKLYGPHAFAQPTFAQNLNPASRGQRGPASEPPMIVTAITGATPLGDSFDMKLRIQRQVEQSMLQITRAQSQAQRDSGSMEH